MLPLLRFLKLLYRIDSEDRRWIVGFKSSLQPNALTFDLTRLTDHSHKAKRARRSTGGNSCSGPSRTRTRKAGADRGLATLASVEGYHRTGFIKWLERVSLLPCWLAFPEPEWRGGVI